jgi:hypothetical protein
VATTAYCTLTDVKNILSTNGVTLRLDDSPPTSADGDVLDDASRLIDEHLLLCYTEANLALSPWVKHATALIAAVHLCERRNNPPPNALVRRYERYMTRLEQGRLGQFMVPDIPSRVENVPRLINGRVVLAPTPHFRVQAARSTGTPESYASRQDMLDILNWWAF